MKLVTKHHLKKNGYYLMYRHDSGYYRKFLFIKVKNFKKFTNNELTFETIADSVGVMYPLPSVMPIPSGGIASAIINDHLNRGLTIDFFELEVEDMGEFV
jgi:hypothetical protein